MNTETNQKVNVFAPNLLERETPLSFVQRVISEIRKTRQKLIIDLSALDSESKGIMAQLLQVRLEHYFQVGRIKINFHSCEITS